VLRAVRAASANRADAVSLMARLPDTAARKAADDFWCAVNGMAERPGTLRYLIRIELAGRRVSYKVIAARNTAARTVAVVQRLEVRAV